METLWRDLQISLRTLLKNPGFLGMSVLVLALGIGATTAIFSFIQALVLHPLDYDRVDRIVQLWEVDLREGEAKVEAAPANYLDWKGGSTSFEHLAAYRHTNFNLRGEDEPERLEGARVTDDFFRTLGVEPQLGRGFLPQEDEAGGVPVAVITDGLWRRQFDADPKVLGAKAVLNGQPYTVVGVLPADFHFPHLGRAEVFAPLAFTTEEASSRTSHWLYVIGLLKEGTGVGRAQAEASSVAAQLAQQHPGTNGGRGVRVVPLEAEVTELYRPSLVALIVAALCLLLLGCANVANLQLARTNTRLREMAVRSTLGASRGRLLRQLFLESLWVSLLGAGLGLLLARWTVDLMVSRLPAGIRNFVPHRGVVPIDGTVILFCVGIGVLTALVFGLAPALSASRPDVQEVLKEGTRGAGSLRARRGRGFLVVSEVALALILLILAALMGQSLSRLQQVDPGFRPDHVLTAQLDPSAAAYPDGAQLAAFYDQVLQRAAAVSGVEAAAVVDHVPFGGSNGEWPLTIEGDSAQREEPPTAMVRSVSPDYFEALGIPVLNGRAFTAQDNGGSPPVVIVNRSMARYFWPDGDYVGKRVRRGGQSSVSPWIEVVGVVSDVKHFGLEDGPRLQIYVPMAQVPQRTMTLVARTQGEPAALASGIRAEVKGIDPDQPLANFRTMDELVSDSLLLRRTGALLLAFFGAIALLVSAVGIFGVISYTTVQRTREMGIRMALGASRQSLLKMVLGQGGRLVAIGLAVGGVLSFGLAQAMSSLLYGVGAADLVTYVVVSLFLAGVAVLASWLPARRATRVDPVVAIRYE